MIETSCEESSTGKCSLLCCGIGICPFELGTNPARQRRFLSVPPTLRGQSEREALRVYCCAVSRAERRRRSSLCLQKECSVCFSFSNLLASFGLSITFYLTKLECSSTSRPVVPLLSHPHCILTISRVHLSSDLQGNSSGPQWKC